jgi:hypothetical protein
LKGGRLQTHGKGAGILSVGLYIGLIVFNSFLTILVLPGFVRNWKRLKTHAMKGRAIAAAFTVIWLWLCILYQTAVYLR